MKDNQKIALLLIVIFACVGAFLLGGRLLKSEGQKQADELAEYIEELKGAGWKELAIKRFEKALSDSGMSEKEKKDRISEAEKAMHEFGINFSFASIKPRVEEGKAVVEIEKPVIELVFNSEKEKELQLRMKVAEIKADKFIVSQNIGKKEHYFYSARNGNADVFMPESQKKSLEVVKIGYMQIEELNGESDLPEKLTEACYGKVNISNVKVIEGRGNTTLVSIKSVLQEARIKTELGKMAYSFNVKYADIIPGDMLRVMLGDIKPVTVTVRGTYSGDDARALAGKQKAYMDKQYMEVGKRLSEPGQQMPKPADPLAEMDFNLVLDELSVMMEKTGMALKGKLNKIGGGGADVEGEIKLVDYRALLAYVKSVAMVPQEKIDSFVAALKEISGQGEAADITMPVEARKGGVIKISGKTESEFKAIVEKHFPPKFGQGQVPPVPKAGSGIIDDRPVK